MGAFCYDIGIWQFFQMFTRNYTFIYQSTPVNILNEECVQEIKINHTE